MLSFYYNIKKGNNLENEDNQIQEIKGELKKMVHDNKQHLGRAAT